MSWLDATWNAWQTMTTVGYGDVPAKTLWGRLITILISTVGIALLGAMFAAGSTLYQYSVDQRRQGALKNPFSDGYVIFNYPGRGRMEALVREIHHTQPGVGICVVDNRLNELPALAPCDPPIHFVRGSILSNATYEQARVCDARRVIVFPTDSNDPSSDGTTKTVIDLLERFIDGETKVVYALVDPANRWMFDDEKAVCILESLEVLAIVQECQDAGTAPAIETLLMNTEGPNPNTFIPNAIVGMTWGEFQRGALEVSRSLNIPLNPFGIVRNGKPNVCPAHDEVVASGDHLLLIVENKLDWSDFERRVQECVPSTC